MNDRNDDTGSNRHDPIDANASPRVIESQIDAKRANINATIEQLEQSISPDRAMEYVKANGGEIAQNLGRSFKNNPVPFILTGVGLAWMMSTSQNPPRRDYQEEDYRRYRSSRFGYAELDDGFDDDYDDDYGSDDMSRDGTRRFATYQGGTRYVGADSDESVAGRDDRLASYGGASYGGGVGTERTSGDDFRSDRGSEGASDDGESLLDKARAKAEEIGEGISDSARNVRDKASDMGESAEQRYRSARLDARERGERMRRDSGRRFDRMRESGSELGYNVRSGVESTANFLREQPLVAGSIGIAIGALLGSLLPATRTEDRYLGERADQFKDEAEERAVEGLERVRGEAEQAASKLRDSAEDAAVRTREKAEEVADKARQEGENKLEEADQKAAEKGDVKPSGQSSGDASKSGDTSKSTSETA